jgi:hypothetical protein
MLLVGTNGESGIVAACPKVLLSSVAKRPKTSLHFFMFASVHLNPVAASQHEY